MIIIIRFSSLNDNMSWIVCQAHVGWFKLVIWYDELLMKSISWCITCTCAFITVRVRGKENQCLDNKRNAGKVLYRCKDTVDLPWRSCPHFQVFFFFFVQNLFFLPHQLRSQSDFSVSAQKLQLYLQSSFIFFLLCLKRTCWDLKSVFEGR